MFGQHFHDWNWVQWLCSSLVWVSSLCRALLSKLETVESALEGAGGATVGGAIPKRKPHSRRLRHGGHR